MPKISRMEVYAGIDTEREYQDTLTPDRRDKREMVTGEESGGNMICPSSLSRK